MPCAERTNRLHSFGFAPHHALLATSPVAVRLGRAFLRGGLVVVLTALSGMAYTAFPSTHTSVRSHRHADGRVHTHAEPGADARAAPERDASARHGGVHAHGGEVHAHGLAAHSQVTVPEAEAPDVTRRALASPVGDVPRLAPRAVSYASRPLQHWASRSPSVETPPPIARG